jgi:Helix-turn-helix domain
MSEIPARDLLTEAEAAQILAIEKLTLAAWRRRGLGPPHLRLPSLGVSVARAIRYRRTDIETFISTAVNATR